MQRSRNIVFAILVSLVFACVIIVHFVALVPGVDMSKRSYLEGRDYKTIASVAKASPLNGKFQSAFESYVADHVPARDEVLLANAELQRFGIVSANVLCRYDAYPTFFGSDYVVVPKDGLVLEVAAPAASDNANNRKAWIRTLNECAREFPSIRFACAQVAEMRHCSTNPTSKLIGGAHRDEAWVQKHVIDKLDPELNAFVDYAESHDELTSLWFPTDVHWKPERALHAYNRIAETLGLKQLEWRDAVRVCDSWYGNFSRHALCLDYDCDLWDLPAKYSNLRFYKLKNGKEFKPGKRASVLKGKENLIEASPFKGYVEYFGGGGMEVRNDGPNNGRSCLVIGDSFVHCLKRPIADNYRNTVFLLPGNDTVKKSFRECIKKYAPDDVIILTHSAKYEQVAKTSPKFMSR